MIQMSIDRVFFVYVLHDPPSIHNTQHTHTHYPTHTPTPHTHIVSEPGRNPHIQRPRMHRLSPTRLSPLQTRKHHDLGKTLSVGAALGKEWAGIINEGAGVN